MPVVVPTLRKEFIDPSTAVNLFKVEVPEMVREFAVRLVADVVASVLAPVTESVPCDVREEVATIFPIVAFDEKRLEKKPVVALSNVAKKPVVVVVPVILALPLTVMFVVLAFPRLVCPDILSVLADKLLAVNEDTVVVASVVGPRTVNLPVDVAPVRSARKAVFSTQLDPFQYKVLLTVVPEASDPPPPGAIIHLVLVPVEEST